VRSQAAVLVAFLSGNAAVSDADDRSKWWLDLDIQERLRLTPQQVQALGDIFAEANGKGHTLMLWRMYQTLTPPQRQQFSQMLQVVRTRQ
jgi:Spy/CpxP family protein refolding chaperone